MKPSYVSIYNLRAGAGLLSFNSIQSGKDEIHLYDLRAGRQYRLSRSRYRLAVAVGSRGRQFVLFHKHTLDGYRLSTQRATADSLVEVEYSELPVNQVNPPRRKWDVMNIDTVDVSFEFAEGTPVKRFRKGTHLFNVHSWAPWDFDPVKVTSETRFNVGVGATVMSQDLLSSTTAYLAYGYVGGGTSQLRGALNYYGLAPEVRARFQLRRRVAVAVRLPQRGAGAETEKVFRPEPEGLPADDSVVGLSHADADSLCRAPPHQRADLGERSLGDGLSAPRGRAVVLRQRADGHARFSAPLAATRCAFRRCRLLFRGGFGRILSLYGRVYLPGLMPHHSLMLRGNLQRQTASDYMFYYKELYPPGSRIRLCGVALRLCDGRLSVPRMVSRRRNQQHRLFHAHPDESLFRLRTLSGEAGDDGGAVLSDADRSTPMGERFCSTCIR